MSSNQRIKSGLFKAFKVFTLFKLAMLSGCEVQAPLQTDFPLEATVEQVIILEQE